MKADEVTVACRVEAKRRLEDGGEQGHYYFSDRIIVSIILNRWMALSACG